MSLDLIKKLHEFVDHLTGKHCALEDRVKALEAANAKLTKTMTKHDLVKRVAKLEAK